MNLHFVAAASPQSVLDDYTLPYSRLPETYEGPVASNQSTNREIIGFTKWVQRDARKTLRDNIVSNLAFPLWIGKTWSYENCGPAARFRQPVRILSRADKSIAR